MLRHHGVTPLMVFDGGPLPAKRGTEVDRASSVMSFLSFDISVSLSNPYACKLITFPFMIVVVVVVVVVHAAN